MKNLTDSAAASSISPATPVRPGVSLFRSAGVSVAVAFRLDGLPEILHWGRDLGPMTPDALEQLAFVSRRQVSASALDRPWPFTILPTERDGWEGRPGMVAARDDGPLLPDWSVTRLLRSSVGFTLDAVASGVELHSAIRLDDAGVLRIEHSVRNTGNLPIQLHALDATMPVDARASELLDFSGRWTRERLPQRRQAVQGSTVRESRRGRTGHDSPLVTIAGTPGFGDRTGELWGVHLAWSGDATYRLDRLPEGRSALGAGELLRPGEIELAPGEEFSAPPTVFVWSDRGLDGFADRVHRSLRMRPSHPRSPRPVVLNTWEAVYFDHDLVALRELVDTAARIGVERFVLDDGWFRGRRSDDAGLGDWTVDRAVWPDGLHPLRERVRAAGMQFGLWVEPEMVNLDSDLARAHPDWLLTAPEEARAWRHQYVLDLARRDVRDHLLEHLDALVTEYDIDYLKWDQNRDLLAATHAGRPGVDPHTRGVYQLLEELRRRHPLLEIESCASGGARVDLGILDRTDRVWASDTNDPVERLAIQRWTELLLPPELIGSHVGPARAHTTGRITDLDFRMAATLFAHPGIEWDITACTAEERAALTAWIALYKRLRPLLHTGDLVHGSTEDSGSELTGVVARDRAHAVYRLARTTTGEWAVPPSIRLPGLDERRSYAVQILHEFGPTRMLDVSPPPWTDSGRLVVDGAVLTTVGLRTPLLAPASALVLELHAV